VKEGKGGKESGSDSDDDHSGEDESHDEETEKCTTGVCVRIYINVCMYV
jgi:hypothetical protein